MARSEGYVRRRGANSFMVTISLGRGADGKLKQLSRTVHGSAKDADAERARMILERDQGVDLKPETVTVAQLFDRWMDTYGADLAPSTAATYATLARTHIIPCLGTLKVRDVKPLHIEGLKLAVLKKGRTQKSALNVFRRVNAVFERAVRWQLISRNPCQAVDPPKPPRFIPFIPKPEQLSLLLEVADRTPYGSVARLAILTAARQGELLRLRWRDVDTEHKLLTIPGTKNRSSYRTVELAPLALELLKAHRTAEKEKRLKLGPNSTCGTDDATIFTNLVGKPMDAGGLKRTWKRVERDANIGHVRFHDLRHCAASYMILAGVPMPMVSQRMGHSRVSTTSDIYAHVLPGMGRVAAEALENVMVNGWSTSAKEANQ